MKNLTNIYGERAISPETFEIDPGDTGKFFGGCNLPMALNT